MRSAGLPLILSIVAVLGSATPALARALDAAAIQAAPQYYLISLPQAPVGEIAEAVLGQALGLPFNVDEDVDAEMAFRIDGVYAPQALAREFGHRLWSVEVVLIEKPSDGLWLIPQAELATALAQGATIVAPQAPAAAPVRNPATSRQPAPPAASRSPSGWSWLGWLIAGWIGGAVTLTGWRAFRRRMPVASISPVSEPPVSDPVSDDLIIPAFTSEADPAIQPKPPHDSSEPDAGAGQNSRSTSGCSRGAAVSGRSSCGAGATASSRRSRS